MPKNVLIIATLLFVGLFSTGKSAVISASISEQASVRATIGAVDTVAKVGTFDFGPSAFTGETLTHVKFDGWLRLAGTNLLTGPQLIFTKPNLSLLDFVLNVPAGLPHVYTDLRLANTVAAGEKVEQLFSPWVSLTSSQATSIATLLTSNSGKVDLFMRVNGNTDFRMPGSTTTLVSLDPFVTQTEYYGAKVDLMTIPEPVSTTAIVLVLGLTGRVIIRIRKGSIRNEIV